MTAVRTAGPAPVHTLRVARRVTSRQLVGRTDELAALRGALTAVADGESRILLVSGDAGIGKTRLVGEAMAGAREAGFRTALGGCLQLGEVSVAYAPLAEALRDLRIQFGEAELDTLLGPGLADIGALLGAGGTITATSSGPLFEHLLAFLSRLAQRQPVLLVFEDVHWADASTRDLIAFLGRNLRDAPVALLLTYRADEIHRRHPLRPLVADLERDPRTERIPLHGISRSELVSLLDEISDELLPAGAVDELLARSEGNPFYVEELIAAGGLGHGLPATLADVIMARVGALTERAQTVLHQAAVLGNEVNDELLATMIGEPTDVVITALREAVFDQMLVIEGDACRFRHALVREALYDDLLPGERERLHVSAARALEATTRLDEHVRWALIAHHWDAAHDAERAFTASVRAGAEAERVHATADAAEQFERALRLRDQVPDAQRLIGMTRAEMLIRTAEAVHASSRSQRAIVLTEAALREMGDAPPEQRALALELLGRCNWTQHHGAAAVAAYEQAVTILEDRPPSGERAFALSALGQSLMVRNLYREAEAVLTESIDIARTVGAPDVEGYSLCSLGPSLVGLGRIDEGLDAMRRAEQLSRRYGTTQEVGRLYINLVHSLYVAGRYDEAARVGAEGIEYAVRTGHQRHHGEAIAANTIAALICSGRWEQAERIRDDPRVPKGDPYQELRWLPLLLRRGRYDEARELVRRSLEATVEADDVQFRGLALMRGAEMAALDERWDEARRLITESLAFARRSDDQYYVAQAFEVGIGIEADRVATGRGPRAVADADAARAIADQLIEQAHEFAAERAAAGIALLPETRLWLATAEAQYQRAAGRDKASGWAAVAADWDELGQPFAAAVARLRQADALLRSRGDRDEAAAVARAALRTAEHLCANPLIAQLRQLGRRGRLNLAEPGAVPARDPIADLNITPRELDVLRLLAEGRTNRQIGEALFISEKTASVHVTNLLRKLGVPNRLEAAAIAQHVGLTDERSGSG